MKLCQSGNGAYISLPVAYIEHLTTHVHELSRPSDSNITTEATTHATRHAVHPPAAVLRGRGKGVVMMVVVVVVGPTVAGGRKVEGRRRRRREACVRVLVRMDQRWGLHVEAGMHVVRRVRGMHAMREWGDKRAVEHHHVVEFGTELRLETGREKRHEE